MNRLTTITLLLGMSVCVIHSYARASELYVGVSHERLANAIGWELTSKMITERGIVVHARKQNEAIHFLICAYPTAEEAGEVLNSLTRIVPLGPSSAPTGPAIGDQFTWWSGAVGSPSGHFRRKNIVVSFARGNTAEEFLSLARQIDNLIRDNREIAPLGEFAQTPEIDTSNMLTRFVVPGPGSSPVSDMRSLQPTFRGLGDASLIRFRIFRKNGFGGVCNHVDREGRASTSGVNVADPDPRKGTRFPTTAPAPGDGRFLIDVQNAHRNLGRTKFKLVAANNDNVVVIKEIEIEFVLE